MCQPHTQRTSYKAEKTWAEIAEEYGSSSNRPGAITDSLWKGSYLFLSKWCTYLAIGHVNFGIIFYCIGNSQWCIYDTQSKSDWLFNTMSRKLQADWLIMENNEAYLNIYMPYWQIRNLLLVVQSCMYTSPTLQKCVFHLLIIMLRLRMNLFDTI